MARTKLRSIRVDDPEWESWEKAALARGMRVSEFIRSVVSAAVDGKPAPAKRRGKVAVVCDRERFHRPGTFCKACGKTT